MATPFSVPINAFLKRIEKDKDFFQYFNLDDEEAAALAEERAINFLMEAIQKVVMECQPEVDFTDFDEETQEFNFDWTPQEKILIPSLMYEAYLERDMAYLKTMNVNFTVTDFRVFDPSNARKTFMGMLEYVHQQNILLMDTYKNTDRLTGKYIGINFGQYDEEE